MIMPRVVLRMEQRDLRCGLWICCQRSIRFVAIAHRTGQAQILEQRLSASRSRHNVLKLETRCCEALSGLAVGVTIRKTLADAPLQLDGNIPAHAPVAERV